MKADEKTVREIEENRYLVLPAKGVSENHWMCQDLKYGIFCVWEQGKFDDTHEMDFRFISLRPTSEQELAQIAWGMPIYLKKYHSEKTGE